MSVATHMLVAAQVHITAALGLKSIIVRCKWFFSGIQTNAAEGLVVWQKAD